MIDGTEILEDMGFSKGEVKVYFALLELGESTTGPLSKKSGITSSKVYPTLEKLKQKGLVTSVIKENTNYFQASNPKQLLSFINEKKKKLAEREFELKKIIPNLVRKQEKEQQSAKVYESFNGIKTLYNEILECLIKSKENFIGFTLGNEYQDEQANLFFHNYDIKRKALGIKVKLIGLESQRDFLKKEYSKKSNVEIRYISNATPTGVIIFGDKVATLVWSKNPTAFVIQSKQVANSYKRFFEDIWRIAKK